MQALVTEADLEAAINQPPDPALYGGLVQDEENGDWSPRPDLCPVLEPWQEDTIAEFKRRDMISAMNAFVGSPLPIQERFVEVEQRMAQVAEELAVGLDHTARS